MSLLPDARASSKAVTTSSTVSILAPSGEEQRDGMSVFFTQRPSSFETLFIRRVKRTSSASQASDCASIVPMNAMHANATSKRNLSRVNGLQSMRETERSMVRKLQRTFADIGIQIALFTNNRQAQPSRSNDSDNSRPCPRASSRITGMSAGKKPLKTRWPPW